MFKEDKLRKVQQEKKKWIEDLSKILCGTPERLPRFTTVSDLEIKGLYTPEDIYPICSFSLKGEQKKSLSYEKKNLFRLPLLFYGL